MKKTLIFFLLTTLLLLAACNPLTTPTTTEAPVSLPSTDAAATTSATSMSGTDVSSLAESLAYMREEEKLAHDVYMFLYERWGLQIFSNIASSEQNHTSAVQSLLVAYGLPDPAEGLAAGQFTNPELQALYDKLTARGAQSLEEALKVGGAIEEIDILDLQARLQGDLPADVRQVFENLLAGSYNHLAAFSYTFETQTGTAYTPQYLTPQAYAEALAQASAGGGHGNGYHGGRP